eukprot:scaffold45536_cov248-Skeletonema_marinoi.AAC.2
MSGYNFDDSVPRRSSQLPPLYSHSPNHDQYPVVVKSSPPPNSFLHNAFPRTYNQAPRGPGCDFNRIDTHDEFLYRNRPSERGYYDGTSHHRKTYGRSNGADNLDEMLFQVDREYQTMEASPSRSHYQRNVQFIEEDEMYTQPGCIRRSLNDVLDLLFPKYRKERPVQVAYPIPSKQNEKIFQSSAIHNVDVRESRGSFDSNGSVERARQYMRDVSHRTSDRASELHDQLRGMVQDRALRQTQARDISIPSAPLEDERLAESRRMLQLQIEQHQAAMTNHMAAMQTQQQHNMSPMYNGMVQNGMVNGMMNHHQLNNMFTPSTQANVGVARPTMNDDGVHVGGMCTMQSNSPPQQVYHQQQVQQHKQDQRDPSECTPRSNDRSSANKQRSGVNLPRSHTSAGSPPRVVKVANGTKVVFSEQQQSDASTIQSIQDTVERAMRKSDAARTQMKSSKKLWSQASKIRT